MRLIKKAQRGKITHRIRMKKKFSERKRTMRNTRRMRKLTPERKKLYVPPGN